MNYREDLIKVSELYFEAQIQKHKVNVENLLENQVGVAEHSDIVDTIEKELDVIASYDDKLNVLRKYFKGNFTSKEVLNG
jgi:hypothetical protein|tara:strand:- start:3091 stop:3330 length:240 start_codon:yes stop_codon:yes gene_type:complete